MGTAAVTASGVHAGYQRREVLRGVDLSVPRGTLVGIDGENGAGKSTLLRCLVGLHRPARGTVTVHGTLGYCPQEPVLVESLTVVEQLSLCAAGYGLVPADSGARIDGVLDDLGAQSYRKERIDRLSGGTRQKVNLAVALLHTPDVLVLDEPYQGFDYDTYQRFWDLASGWCAAGRTVVVVSHVLGELERFDRLLSLSDGRLVPSAARDRQATS